MSGDQLNQVVGRRNLVRWLAATAGMAAAAPLIAACAAPAPAPAPTSAPAAAPAAKATEAPKPAAAAPTSAPAAAAKPTEAAKPAAGATVAPGGGAIATPRAQASAKTKLLAAFWSDSPADHNVWQTVFNSYMEKNSDVAIEFDDIPSAEFTTKILTMVAGGAPPDIQLIHAAWVVQFITSNTLADLTDRMKADKTSFEDYHPQQLEYWAMKGKNYGVPYYSGLSSIFYNKDIFQKKGMKTPEEYEKEGKWTWETLRQVAKEISGGTGADKVIGFDGAQNVWNMQYFLCCPVWSNGGELTNKDETEWLVTSDVFVEQAQLFGDMAVKDKSLASKADLQGTTQVFWTGRVAMAWGIKAHTVSIPIDKMNVGHAPVPTGKSGRVYRDGPNGAGLPAAGKNIDAAYKLAAYIPSPDSPYLSSGRSFPVRKSLANAPIYLNALKPYENKAIWEEGAKLLRPWRVPGKSTEIQRIFTAAGDTVLLGQATAKEAMAKVKPEMDALLKV